MEEADYILEVSPNKSKLKEYLTIVVITLLFCFSTISFYSSKELKGEAKQLQINLEKSKAELKKSKNDFKIVKDSMKIKDSISNTVIKDLNGKINDYKNDLKDLKDQNNKKQQQLNNWENKDYVAFLQERYKTKNVQLSTNGVELQKDTPHKVVSDLFNGDFYKLSNITKDSIIQSQDVVIDETNKKLDNKTFELEKAEEVIFDYDKVNYDQNELIENQKKNIKFLDVQNTLLKVAIPVTIVATVLTTILIVK